MISLTRFSFIFVIRVIFLGRWTGKMLGEAIILHLHANEFNKATEILKKLIKDEEHIIGVPDQEVLSLYMELCIENNNTKEAMVSLI